LLRAKNIRYGQFGPYNFSVSAKECVSLTGPSGTGKSLLLRCLADLIPHDGEVFLDEQESQSIPAPQWRKRVGMLPAKSAWWFDKVGEHFREFDEPLFRRLGFERRVLDWNVARLSTGEQQRLSLLRLLQNQPEVLLLDEPTSALDSETVQKAEDLLAEYRANHAAAVLWVTHDKNQAKRVASRHLRMRENQLTEVAESDL
jgi:ABC-type iron transport system FetAB ATPase subunit